MICPYCGAEYDESALNCPYCGAENTKEADSRYKSELKSIDDKIFNLRFLPGKLVRTFSKKGAILLAAALMLVLLGSIAMAVVNSFNNSKRIERRNDNKEVLEKYFQQGEYGLMYEYYYKFDDHYGSIYEKYFEVGSAYNDIHSIRSSMDCIDGKKKEYKYDIWFALNDSIDLLKAAEEAVNDNVLRGNESILQDFINEVYTYYRDYLKLTEEEIQDLRSSENLEDSYFDQKTEELLERLGLAE